MDPELDFHEQGEDFLTGINLTPFVDIIFNLLIFFMLTATLALPEALDVNLPTAESAERAIQTELAIVVDRDGSVRVHNELLSGDLVSALKPILERHQPESVAILSDRGAPVSALISVMDALRLLGKERIAIATLAPEPSR